MNMSRTAIVALSVVALAAVAMYYIHESENRYTMLVSGPGVTYKIDKKTGRSWKFSGNKSTEMISREEMAKRSAPLPKEERDKITGTGGFSRHADGFRGQIYNGSDWTITGFVVVIDCLMPEQESKKGDIKDPVARYLLTGEPQSKWTRRYSVRKEIQPLSECQFMVANDVRSHPFDKKSPFFCADERWYLDEVSGWKE